MDWTNSSMNIHKTIQLTEPKLIFKKMFKIPENTIIKNSERHEKQENLEIQEIQ